MKCPGTIAMYRKDSKTVIPYEHGGKVLNIPTEK